MKPWIVSVVGVICLSLLLEIVVPEGKTAKYIRGAFSLVVVLVIISPLPKLLKMEWKIDLDSNAFNFDDSNGATLSASYINSVEEAIELYLANEGYIADVKVEIDDGKIAFIKIVLSRNSSVADEAQKIKLVDLVAQKYRVPPSKIEVIVVDSGARARTRTI